ATLSIEAANSWEVGADQRVVTVRLRPQTLCERPCFFIIMLSQSQGESKKFSLLRYTYCSPAGEKLTKPLQAHRTRNVSLLRCAASQLGSFIRPPRGRLFERLGGALRRHRQVALPVALCTATGSSPHASPPKQIQTQTPPGALPA